MINISNRISDRHNDRLKILDSLSKELLNTPMLVYAPVNNQISNIRDKVFDEYLWNFLHGGSPI